MRYDFESRFSEGLASVCLKGSLDETNWGFINKEGKKITEIKYDNIESFKNGIAVIILNGRKGIIDQEGKEYFFTRGKKIGSRRSTLYFVKHKDTIIFNTGCFIGDKDAFIKAIKETHGDNNHAYNHLNYIREIEEKLAI